MNDYDVLLKKYIEVLLEAIEVQDLIDSKEVPVSCKAYYVKEVKRSFKNLIQYLSNEELVNVSAILLGNKLNFIKKEVK